MDALTITVRDEREDLIGVITFDALCGWRMRVMDGIDGPQRALVEEMFLRARTRSPRRPC